MNVSSSTSARCFSRLPRVIVDAAVVARSPAVSSPPDFHAKVARCRSRAPTIAVASSAARGGSGQGSSFGSLIVA